MISAAELKELSRGVLLPTFVAVLAIAILVGGVLLYSTQRSDKLAAGRQEQQLVVAIRDSVFKIQNDQEASTWWDDAVLRLREVPLDMAWLDNNMGTWFHEYYDHDEVYILDASNHAVYAMRAGQRVQPGEFASVSDGLLPLVQELRAELRNGAEATREGAGQTIGVWQQDLIRGRPAIISIKPVVPESDRVTQSPDSTFAHISIRFMDESWAQGVSRELRIDNLHFGASPGTDASLPMFDEAGNTMGYFRWSPFRPGQQVRETLMPVLLGVLLLSGLVLAVLLLRIWRSRADLESSRKRAQHLAYHDHLTGLPNRSYFDERLGEALARDDNGEIALILLDLDRFKNVNDTLGHQAGDCLIREFAARLTSLVRPTDLVARLGGDEFAVVFEHSNFQSASAMCERIAEKVRAPFNVVGGEAYVGVSAGIAMSSPQVRCAAELTRRADIAMYRAKVEGKGIHRAFNSDMDFKVRQYRDIEVCLRHALASREGLHLLYQPEVCGRTGEVLGMEALIRWNHPVLGQVPTELLIDVAEETGLIVPLGEWVLEEACRKSVEWPGLFMAVNLSPVQFQSATMADRICAIVAQTGADPRSIQLEVTERLLLANTEGLRATFSQLKQAGFSIVLDDFGTGYSSLSYLQLYPFDKLKIDKSFVACIGKAEDASSIVIAVLALAQALRLVVTAEGVETEGQRQFLIAAGCAEMQGYLFYPPISEDDLKEVLSARQASVIEWQRRSHG